jgi:prepilin-type processing-associated H-X9-DG protein
MSNLRQIGLACIMYSTENAGKLPDDIGQLVTKENLKANVFVSPGHHVPAGLDPKATADWVKDNSDYEYVGGGKDMKQMGPDKILAHEKMEIAASEHGMNILYGDGHVEFVGLPEAQRRLQANGQ